MLVKTLVRSCILVTALMAFPSAFAQVAHTPTFDGTWWLNAFPPPFRPLILTMTRSGEFVLEDSIDRGGHTFSGNSFSLVQGSWTRTGPHSAEALGLRFVYDEGKTRAVERVRLNLVLEDFDQIRGELNFEEMACTEEETPFPYTVPICPDPTIAPTEVLRGPAPFTGVRVPIDSPLQ